MKLRNFTKRSCIFSCASRYFRKSSITGTETFNFWTSKRLRRMTYLSSFVDGNYYHRCYSLFFLFICIAMMFSVGINNSPCLSLIFIRPSIA